MAATLLDTLFVELVFKGDRRELDKWDRGIKNLNQRLNNLVRPFTIAGTVGAASLGLIGKAGLDTEKALLRLRAELGLTEDQMRALREEALRVGSDLPLNTADIVNAQRAYGKLGATFAEIIRDAPAIAGAAVATDLQPEQVARYARIVQNVFGGDPQENLDIMVRLATRSQGDFLAFGEALQFSGQAAADAGLDFKTYISVLGGLAGSGRSVESVSQGLQAIWAKLAKAEEGIGEGGAVVQKAFEGVGISMTDVNATMDGTADSFVRLLELINNAGLSPTQRSALLSTLADVTYASAVSSAVQNTEKIRDLLADAALAPGEISRQQEAVLSGASGGITIMLAQIDTLLNRLAEFGTLTFIESFTNKISGLIGWLTKANEENELVNKRWLQMISIGVTALASLLAVAGALKVTTFALSGFVVVAKVARGVVWLWRNALILTRIQMGLLNVQTWLNTVASNANTASIWGRITALLASRAAMLASVVATGAATAATWAFNAALLANPITWIVLAIAGLIAGLVLLVKNWDAVRDAIGRAWERVRSFFSGLPGWVTVALAVIAPFIGIPILIIKHWDTLKTFFANLWDWIVDKVMWAWNQVSGIFDAIGGFFGFGGGEIEVRTSTRANPAPPAVPTLDEGGIVRRPTLAMLAVNRQPEAVVPLSLLNQLTDKLKAMLNSLDRFIADFRATQAGKNFVANLPVLMDPSKPLFPTVPPRAFAGAGAGPTYIDNRTVNVSEGAVVVNAAPGQDPVEIAQVVTQRLRDQIQAIPPAFDSGIKR